MDGIDSGNKIIIMSQDKIEEEADVLSCCACCGKAEIDDIKLKECDDCFLVKYCSDECRNNHKSEHEQECKKRAAELRDELLFKQPEESYLGDCPICSLPLPIDLQKSSLMTCCSKIICNGCRVANLIRESDMRLQHTCPFCREPIPELEEENEKFQLKRIQANDPVAICHEGGERHYKGDYEIAFEYWTMAAELGNADAYYKLALLEEKMQGVEKDEGKYIHNLEEAAISGHPNARYFLGMHEWNKNGNVERAVKHWIIAATQGDDESMKQLMAQFKEGYVSKDDLASTLRAHKAAVDATKSPQRGFTDKFRFGEEEKQST